MSDERKGSDVADTPLADAATDESAGGDLTRLEAELQSAQAKAEENWNLYLQAQAEMQNIRRRAERDIQDAHRFALEKFLKELLPVKDSLELGLAAADQDGADVAKLREGSELILKSLSAVVEKFGVEELNPIGERFDPQFHQALAMQPTDQAEPNTVLQVVQKGYALNGRLVREARVVVAQAPRTA